MYFKPHFNNYSCLDVVANDMYVSSLKVKKSVERPFAGHKEWKIKFSIKCWMSFVDDSF